MAVTIVIQRTVPDKEMADRLAPMIVQLRSKAATQPGFLTGQTFSCLDCQGEYMVISTWHSLDDWNRWKNSKERQELQNKVDALLGEETQYRIYQPVVGGIIPEFKGTET
ncbi:MAG: antibiotic biosynthesis monooxygenase [Desulfobacteraceae bacterium]|nr:MAG: antibiotic biosynthesis monooxygenase [Desulfobacteraceae bacterium]